MLATDPGADRFRKAFVLGLTAAISVAFFATIRAFLMALLLAAVLAGICRPLHRRLIQLLRGRASVAAALTILFLSPVRARVPSVPRFVTPDTKRSRSRDHGRP